MLKSFAAVVAVWMLLAPSRVLAEEADPAWTQAANAACTKAAGRSAKVVPDWNVIDVEKCDNVTCDAGNRKLRVNLPDGSPCIRYLIVTPPPRPVKGTCVKSACRTK
ncbi:hypothetical protein MYSTI_05301 [Myxococcus stipitatus DSM 14675]|uniref:Lipoprotein n=1 Tax=Myxococcus stipitatus (strain DSM 14675 / JCM 12634 / Mx s8) TaxID=1278073 RepID=L7UCF8_MYXSD|nr:hypothetical protein [Myxococcus stipitatus]AGC46581.1 hypothetical protein MYSTI_05301 [Myxococcus stipitatus DSM 14675]